MKKNDFYLISILIFISIAFIIYMQIFKKAGNKAIVYVDGKVYKTFDLNEDTTFTIKLDDDKWNTFVIKDGYLDMIDASCKDLVCVNSKAIHYNNETIVCLPNRVVIEISNSKDNPVDSIVN